MLLTLQDDGVLRVYERVEDAVREVEALDADEVFRSVFDETGEVYAIERIRPNARGRLFGLIVGNGEYTLTPEHRKDVQGLLRLIRTSKIVEPPSAVTRVRELERRLTSE